MFHIGDRVLAINSIPCTKASAAIAEMHNSETEVSLEQIAWFSPGAFQVSDVMHFVIKLSFIKAAWECACEMSSSNCVLLQRTHVHWY